MNGLGLSREALEARRSYLCASDAAAIMAGEWKTAWRIKLGLVEEPPFYDTLDWFIKKHVSREEMALKRQLGQFTEPFNLAYCMQQTGRRITYYSGNALMQQCWETLTGEAARADELQVSRVYPFMACNLDGMTTTARGESCVIDAKHVGRADDPMILRYTAAGTHQATVMGIDWWALSVLIGNGKWALIEQEVDPLYQAELVATEREFWGYVQRGEEPEDRTEPVLPPKPQPRLRTVQLDDEFRAHWGGENWAAPFIELAYDFAGTEAAAKRHAIVRKEMVELIPADVGEVTRGLFKAKRDKAGAWRLSVKRGESDADT